MKRHLFIKPYFNKICWDINPVDAKRLTLFRILISDVSDSFWAGLDSFRKAKRDFLFFWFVNYNNMLSPVKKVVINRFFVSVVPNN